MVNIKINDKVIKEVLSVQINQQIDNHQFFRLELPCHLNEETKWEQVGDFGDTIKIEVKYPDDESSFVFNGIIQSKMLRINANTPFVSINGHSPTMSLLRSNNRSFTDQTPSEILNVVLSKDKKRFESISENLPQSVYDYSVQYNETDWDFLQRITARSGTHICYDGSVISFGKLTDMGKDIQLVLSPNENLECYTIQLGIEPFSKGKSLGYDYIKDETTEDKVEAHAFFPKDILAKKMMNISIQTFARDSIIINNDQNQSSSKKIDLANKLLSIEDLAVLQGTSNDTSLKLGSQLKIDCPHLGEFFGTQTNPAFRIIELHHSVTENQSYQNTFRAIPANIEYLPNRVKALPHPCAFQVATVKEIDDPEKLGRIRVSHLWDHESSLSPWIRILNKASGKDNFQFHLPAINDRVVIGFENNDPEKPICLGSFFHGGAKPSKWSSDESVWSFGDIEFVHNKSAKKSRFVFGNVEVKINHQTGTVNIGANAISIDIKNSLKIAAKTIMEFVAKLIKLN